MADLLVLTCCYLGFAVVLIGLLLFGENPALRGTPVAWAHWALTEGVWVGLE